MGQVKCVKSIWDTSIFYIFYSGRQLQIKVPKVGRLKWSKS